MRKVFVVFIGLMALALVATSCSAHVTGGGFIVGDEGGTASFGFNFKCDGFDAKGQITYHDADSGLKIHGTFDSCTYGIGTVTGYGDYRPQGPSDWDGGTFKVTGIDRGEPGDRDYVKIWLSDDNGDTYYNSGRLVGGNLQEH
jgi:hypothetical protein